MRRHPEIHNQHDHPFFPYGRGPRGHGAGRQGGPGFGGFGPGFGGFGPGFGPGGRGRANRGDVRSAIFSLLAESPSNGYGLIKAIAEKTGGVWRPSPGSIYPTLQQLVDEELIAPTGDGKRTEFELTEAGRGYVAEHAEELSSAWEATAGQSEADGEFHASVTKFLGVVQQFRFAATAEQRAQAAEKIDEARKALYLLLAD
ncbi:PadR family transcriptional regulator [Herbiconiux sp. P15]|uniref:PadR family transcriptional regulator n=1 Tax=Herbiconiux liukaitaii TaxID=3342799 RepID=UPI0035B72313